MLVWNTQYLGACSFFNYGQLLNLYCSCMCYSVNSRTNFCLIYLNTEVHEMEHEPTFLSKSYA